jgi:GT2 family glycosyltransferase
MYLCPGLEKIAVYVINLKERKEKRKYIHTHLNRRGIDYQLFQTTRHVNPKRGCLESHLTIIEKVWKEGKYDKLLLFEDDASFIQSLKSLKRPPADWDMIYFGGTVYRVMEKNVTDGYSRVQCWTTHAYMIHLKNEAFMTELLKMKEYEHEIDRYYLEKIHPHYKCYMIDPMICLQKDGFSDIENRMVNYDFMQYTLNGLLVPEHEMDEQKQYILKLPNMLDAELPYVSIVTPTFKRRALFSMAIRNFENFIYPKEKIEWVIVEDIVRDPTDDSYESIEDLLPRDKRIKYISFDVDEPYTVAMKRNIGVSHSSHAYIVHMDDDDYYPPESVLARVKLLLKYKDKGIECLGSTLIGTYNILTNTSSMSSDGPISLSEASMAYTKSFWEKRGFDELCVRGEHKYFTEQRLHQILDVPYCFILIAMCHRTNITDGLRNNGSLLKYTENNEVANFFDTWDEETQMFIMDLHHYLTRVR